MKKSRLILAVISLLLIGYFTLQRINHNSAIAATIEWARLAPYPSNCEAFQISETGTMFTREFEVTFTAPRETITNWLRQCPGLAAQSDFSKTVYEIKPASGANFAQIRIDWSANKVFIKTYWS